MRVTGFLTRSIPGRILAALLSIYFATYIATAVIVYSGVRASIFESNAVALNQLADVKYGQLANVIGALATDLTAWSKLDAMNDLVSGDIDKRVAHTLEDMHQLYRLAGDIYAFDASGKLLASSRGGATGEKTARIPREWHSAGRDLVLVDKETDPMGGGQVVALEIPVFGRFEQGYRIGTLVMTYPWRSIESLLFSLENGTVLVQRGKQTKVLAANPPNIVDEVGFSHITAGDSGANGGFVIGRSIPRSGLLGNWQVVTLLDSDSATPGLRRVAVGLALLGVLLGVPIVFLGRWLSRRLTAPIADLTRVVREITETERLDARAPVPSTDELGSLARSFNRMTDKLERTTSERERFMRELSALNQSLEAKISDRTRELEAAVNGQRRLIADISHEIKSPLARLGMALGLARRSAEANMPRQFDRIEREIENISALASELLTLARLDGIRERTDFAPVDLGALVDRIVADAVFETPERAADVVFDKGEAPITVVGNAALLRRAIENIVRNAIFYTGGETLVQVSLSRASPDTVCVTVRDDGPGVPQAALAHLFEPFYRVDAARARETGGTGVGLAICQRVVELHGGSVRASNHDPHGLVVEIRLPAEPPATGPAKSQSAEEGSQPSPH